MSMWTKDEEARRLAIRFDGINQAAFAREHDVPGGASLLSQHIKGRRPLNLQAAAAYARGFGVPLDEISPRLAAEAAAATTGTALPAFSEQNEREKSDGGDFEIAEYDAGGGMDSTGRLLLDSQPGIIKSWRVSPDWLRLNVPAHTGAGNLCIVTGFGPSMRPMFNPGDPLLVDRGVRVVDHEGVYFFRIGEEGYIKLVQRVPEFEGAGFTLRIISKNPDFPPYDVSPRNPHLEILGKVLMVWRSEQF